MNEIMRVSGWSIAAAALGVATGCGAAPVEEDVNTVQQSLQLGYVGLPGLSGDGIHGLELVTANSQVGSNAKASGVLRRNTNFGGNQFSCGLTFVTQKIAITAGHCLEDQANLPIPAGLAVTVEQVNTTNYNTAKLSENARVSGTWNGSGPQYNDYVHYNQPNEVEGYYLTSYSCVALAYCGPSTVGHYNCPSIAGNVDIGAVKCSSRTVTGGHVAPSLVDPGLNLSLNVRWFHEILYLATNSIYDDSLMPDGNWAHYGGYNGSDRSNNYHYNIDTAHDTPHRVFPLLSWKDKAGTLYKLSDKAPMGPSFPEYWLVSARGCHGTSGAGVFGASNANYYGPITSPGDGWPGGLCDDLTKPAGTAADGQGMVFVARSFTRAVYDYIKNL